MPTASQVSPKVEASHPRLAVDRLSKSYGSAGSRKTVISDLTFSIQPSEYVSIVGPSGVGKTTLLKCLGGLLPPTSGSGRIDGRPIKGPPREMALVFQDYTRSLMPWLTVIKNVMLPLRGKRVSRSDMRIRSEQALERVGLAENFEKYPWQLSGGMQQRVAIARALAYQSEILLMDEPFASVDAQTRFDLEDLMLSLRDELDITLLFVTHDIDEAVYISDRVVVLNSKPCKVESIIDINLPWPRDQIATRALPEFTKLRTEVMTGIRH